MARPSEHLQRQMGISFRKCTGDQTVILSVACRAACGLLGKACRVSVREAGSGVDCDIHTGKARGVSLVDGGPCVSGTYVVLAGLGLLCKCCHSYQCTS